MSGEKVEQVNWEVTRYPGNPLGTVAIKWPGKSGTYAYATHEPFGNCQNWTMTYFGTFIEACRERELDIRESVLEVRKALGTDKRVLIVDILESDYEKIENSFTFLKTMPYENLTGSEMRICLIRL